MSSHRKITWSLSASTLSPHFTYIVEGFLLLSEFSVPSTPWLQPQLSSLAMLQGVHSSSSDPFSLGGGQWQSCICHSRWCGATGGVGRAMLCFGGAWDASALYYPQPAQCSPWCPR